MSDALPLIAAWIAGAALAVLFFGGLWWTVPRGIVSRHPALWFGMSLLLRVGAVLAGVYLVGRGDWIRMAACLAGFVMMKPLILWATRRFTREAGDAPHA